MSQVAVPLIRKLMRRHHLTRGESFILLKDLLKTDINAYQFLAFSVASQTKGETQDEILGMFDALQDVTGLNSVSDKSLTDISSSGGGQLKKINVSTLSALVVGTPEKPVPKQSFWGITSVSGSSNTLNEIGIFVPSVTLDLLNKSLAEVGVGFYHHLHMSPGLNNLVSFGNVLRDVGVNTPFNLVAPMYTPLDLNYRLFGINDEKQLNLISSCFKKMGYENVWVVHAVGGMDEISNFGPTKIKGFIGESEIDVILNPEDAGITRSSYDQVKSTNIRSSTEDFMRIVYGLETGPKRDLVLINSGAALYLSGQAKDLFEGVSIARKRLENGSVGTKLTRLVKIIGDPAKLKKAKELYL